MTKLETVLKKYLGHHIDGYIFATAYCVYGHGIDDIIDGDKNDNEFILKVFRLSISLYGCKFYLENINVLRPLMEVVHDSYRDSVMMEKANDDQVWKKIVGDIIRSNANDVILTCILLIDGLEARNNAAIEVRELSYKQQHNLLGV